MMMGSPIFLRFAGRGRSRFPIERYNARTRILPKLKLNLLITQEIEF